MQGLARVRVDEQRQPAPRIHPLCRLQDQHVPGEIQLCLGRAERRSQLIRIIGEHGVFQIQQYHPAPLIERAQRPALPAQLEDHEVRGLQVLAQRGPRRPERRAEAPREIVDAAAGREPLPCLEALRRDEPERSP